MLKQSRRLISSMLVAFLVITSIFGNNVTAQITDLANVATSGTVVSDAKQVSSNNYGLVSQTEGNILHAWDWKYSDVTKSIKDIAEAGYSIVQVSPAQQCENFSTNNEWWKIYQPYDYAFGNSLGSAEDFKTMCSTAKGYGVHIIVDIVPNHMAGTGQGVCGDRKSEVNSWWTNDKFHNLGIKFTGAFDEDREKMVLSNIGMPDVNTEHPDVQARLVTYLNELLDMGAEGFRFDAAKHIGTASEAGNCKSTFWTTVVSEVKKKNKDALIYGEILNNMPVSDELYVKDGIKVTESQKGWDMKDLLKGTETVSNKTAFTYKRKASANNLITWVENHDTYLNHWGSTGLEGHENYMSDSKIILAWSTVAARADAQALFFARPDGCSPPANPNDSEASNTIEGPLGISTKNNIWKDKAVGAVNKFKNAMVGQGETCTAQGNVAVIVRGSKGVVATNFGSGDASLNASGLSELKDGTYNDASGQNGSFTVSGGKVTGTIKGNTFAVIYDKSSGGSTTPGPTASVTPGKETPSAATATPTVSKDDTLRIRVKESEFSTAPYVYFYEGSATVGPAWPGTQMTKENGYWVFTSTTMTSGNAIFNDGADWQDPQKDSGAYEVTGYMEYSKTDGTVTSVDTPTLTPTEVPTEGPTETELPWQVPMISSSLKDGDSFKTETEEVELSFKNTTKVSYSVDNGPVKTVDIKDRNQKVKVTIGLGKIADTNVTLKLKAINEKLTGESHSNVTEETFTFKKVFVKKPVESKVISTFITNVVKILKIFTKSVMSGAPESSYYATNPNKQLGANKTITSASDFTEDMMIAQGVANDDPRIFRGPHEGPVYDVYALYGAWDDNNVYIGIQYTNVTDVTASEQGYPISDNGKPNNGDIPQMLVFDRGTGDYTDGTANDVKQKTAWDINVKYAGSANVDAILTYSPKKGVDNKGFFPVVDGIVDYNTATTTVGNAGPIGATVSFEDGFFGSNLYGITGNGYIGYTPDQLNSDSSDWVDFLTTNHDTKQDTFSIVTVPYTLLGISKSDIESKGLGVMAIPTFGASGIGSIPMDMSMLDNAMEEYSQDESSSHEKEDEDIVTVPLARLGNGEVPDTPTKRPVQTETPTATPSNTPVCNTQVPTGTPEPDNTTYCVNFGADRSAPQLDTTELTLSAVVYNGKEPYTYTFYVDGKEVQNSEVSTYQWSPTEGDHTIKVEVTDESGNKVASEKEYIIEKDGGNSSTSTPVPGEDTPKPGEDTPKPGEDTPKPGEDTPKPGEDTPKPGEDTPKPGEDTPKPGEDTPKPGEDTPKPGENTPKPTAVPTKRPTQKPVQNNLKIKTIKANKSLPQYAGTSVKYSVSAKGGKGPYKYQFVVKNSKNKIVKKASFSKKPYIIWKPTQGGTYRIFAYVQDKNKDIVYASKKVVYKKVLAVSQLKLKKKKANRYQVTAKVSNRRGKVKYRFYAKNAKGKKINIRSYNTKNSVLWKNIKKGKYTVYVVVKDSYSSASKKVKFNRK